MLNKFYFLTIIFSFFLLKNNQIFAQIPYPALVGYWQNWDDSASPFFPLDQVDSRYNVVNVSFAINSGGTFYNMDFTPDGNTSTSTLINNIQTLQSEGRKVLISIGGATATVIVTSLAERDVFVTTMNNIINTYGFDGIDIDYEGSSLTVSSGTTITSPTDPQQIYMIQAIQQIMADYRANFGKKCILTMAPETAYVQGGQSNYSGLWGGYLPFIHALRDSIDLLHVQLYNSGSMYGIDGGEYFQGTPDFIVAMTEATIQGFNTNGGFFAGFDESKIAVGLPACSTWSGGGYINETDVKAAMDYLLGNGPQPGAYTLQGAASYPNLGGMMTWSVNWDRLASCNGVYTYADNFEDIFANVTPSCGQNLTITASDNLPNGAFLSENSIEINTLVPAGDVVFEAADYILFQPDFWAAASNPTTFIARIVPCISPLTTDENPTENTQAVSKQDTLNGIKINEPLLSIYPNPNNGVFQLKMNMEQETAVSIEVFDISGKLVKSVLNGKLEIGKHTFGVDVSDVGSGVFFVKMMKKNDKVEVMKMVVE